MISKHIEAERELEIALNSSSETKANISYFNKKIFYRNEEDIEEEIILPELEHGKHVELQGYVNRETEKTNTIGFEYSNHSLVCSPKSGSVILYKKDIFDNCIIKGVVNRIDSDGNFLYKKPRIVFTELIKVKPRIVQGSLFTEEDYK